MFAFAPEGVRRPRPRAVVPGANQSLLSRAMKILRVIRWLVVFALVALFVTCVWPTRFRYDHMTVDGNLVPVRIDRFNGDADMLVPDEGWIPVEGTEPPTGITPAARPS